MSSTADSANRRLVDGRDSRDAEGASDERQESLQRAVETTPRLGCGPDAAEAVDRARRLARHRTRHYTRGRRQWKRLGKKVRAIRQRGSDIQTHAERHQAMSVANSVIVIENLALR